MSWKSMLWVSLALLVWSGVGPAAEIDPNLVGWWEFEDGSGTVAADSSGRSVAGELFGDPVWGVSGRRRGVLVLDGADDYVFIDGLFRLPVYTMTVWFRVDGSGQRDILSAYAVGVQHGILLELRDDGTLRYLHRYPLGTGGGTNIYTTETYDDGSWYHAAIVKSEDMIALYVNGEEVGSAADTSVFDPTDAFGLAVGVLDDERGTARLFLGPIDDVQVYDRPLSAEEIGVVMRGRPYPSAYDPTPADGTLLGAAAAVLRWSPGDFATSHNVYFGASFEAVDQATSEDDAFAGNQSAAVFVAPNLVPGQMYYWRIDEVNDADPASPWKGDVWSFQVQPVTAWDPAPANAAPNVRSGEQLSWKAGMNALFYTVYFGESFDDVNNATTGGAMQVETTYDPGVLNTDTTYYWRVDQSTGTVTNKGEVWSFTTVPEVLVSDPTLVGWWTLDEGAGNTAVDWSGHGHHGAILGAAQWNALGIHSGALVLDGVSNHVAIEGMRDSNTVLAQYTMAVWFRADRRGGARDLIAAYLDGSVFGVLVELTADGTMRFLHRSITGGIETDLATTATYDDGRWHHVAVVKTADELLGYIDGDVVVSGVTDDTFDDSFYVALGVLDHLRANGRFFPGPIDDARVYNRALTAEEVRQVMRGDPALAWNPEPMQGAIVDVRDAAFLRWSPGDGATSHDVYVGTDLAATGAAGPGSAEHQGNQTATSLSLDGIVELGGGDYYWRVDEIEADGTVHAGRIWTFTVPDYLVIDDFEGYSNEVGERPFEVWIDGFGFSLPDPGHPGNGTTAAVGHDVWSPTSPYYNGQIMETALVNSGGQSLPIDFNNVNTPYYGEAARTWRTPQNWTVHGVDTLTLYVRGRTTNTPDSLYVALEDNAGNIAVVAHPDPDILLTTSWTRWDTALSQFAVGGVDVAGVKTMYLGFGNRDNPVPGGGGTVYFDDVRITLSAGQ